MPFAASDTTNTVHEFCCSASLTITRRYDALFPLTDAFAVAEYRALTDDYSIQHDFVHTALSHITVFTRLEAASTIKERLIFRK